MLNSIEEIIHQLKEGKLLEYRHENLELKKSWRQEHGKKISAFANSKLDKPCWLCVGIEDDGILLENSEKWAKDTEEIISNHLNQFLDPQITCQKITCQDVGGRWFIIIEFSNPGAVVYWNKSAYIASGTTITEMSPADVLELTVKLPGLSDYTAQEWIGNCDSDLITSFCNNITRNRVDTMYQSLNELDIEEKLERIGIKNTNVCRILFGDCSYRVVFYDNNDIPIRNLSYNGLFHILTETFQNEIQSWTKDQLGYETNPYPKQALKEAISNAVAHASYFENNGDIIIEVFPNKLSISNLCLKESEYFANKWFSNSHKTINKSLMEIFRLSGFVDELGRGKSLIFSQCLVNGKKPPQVFLEKGGRYHRWRLYLYATAQDFALLKVLDRLRNMYKDEHKSLIAYSLVLWRGNSVTNIKKYIDGESKSTFLEVLNDLNGPIFYYVEDDRIVLRRWTKILIGEGKDSKKLSAPEEKDMLDFARKIQLKYHHGYITPKELRQLASMGDTKSEQVISSQLLQKWQRGGIVKKIKRGLYQFVKPKIQPDYTEIINKLFENVKIEE